MWYNLQRNYLYTDTQHDLVLITLSKGMTRQPHFTSPPNNNANNDRITTQNKYVNGIGIILFIHDNVQSQIQSHFKLSPVKTMLKFSKIMHLLSI